MRVQPRAHKDEISGERNGALGVRVVAPPVDGKANEAARKLIARRMVIAAGRISVVRGSSSRDKLIEVKGMDAEGLRRELARNER